MKNVNLGLAVLVALFGVLTSFAEVGGSWLHFVAIGYFKAEHAPDCAAEVFGALLLVIALLVVVLLWVAHNRSRVASRLRTNLDVVEELVTGYTAICYADLETGTYEDYIISSRISESARRRTKRPLIFDQLHAYFDSEAVHLDSRADLHAFYPSDAAWRERLRDRKKISAVFRRRYDDGVYRWTRMDVIRRGKVGEAVRWVVVAFSDCDAEFRVQNGHRVREQILETLIKTYFGYNVTVNLSTWRMTLVRGVECEAACDSFEKLLTYDQVEAGFASRISDDGCRRRALELMSQDALLRFAAEGRRGFVGSCEYPVRCGDPGADARIEWRETNVFINTDADGTPIANIVGRDITERKRQAEAETKLEVAQEASRAQSEFLFNMSHDVRSPMHAILGFADMIVDILMDETRPCEERLRDVRENIGKIRSSGDLLLSILNSILDVNRLETGRVRLSESPGDVFMAFDGVKSTTLELAKEKNIDLAFEFGDVTDRYVFADIEKSNRVFLNILTNAIRYTPEGGRIRARGEQIGRGVYRFTIRDNGIGMAPEFLSKLYDRFAREQNTTMSGVAGLGLGLSIAKAFVDLMGGTIDCQSEKGVGTTFVITLPCRPQEGSRKYVDAESGREVDAASPRANPSGAVGTKPFAGQRVLLVDDAKLNRDVSKYHLTAAGCEVDVACDGAEAVDLVRRKGPGHYYAIMMDIQMPVMDGYEATRQIRRWEEGQNLAARGLKPVPIIAWSANAFEEDREKSLAAGMNDHIAKCAKSAQVRELIAHWGHHPEIEMKQGDGLQGRKRGQMV